MVRVTAGRANLMKHLYAAVAAVTAALLALNGSATALADPAPPEAAPDPFPDIRYYDEVDANTFALPGGVWFIAPTGQNCGIWGLGSFGCAGQLPGSLPRESTTSAGSTETGRFTTTGRSP